MTRPLLPLIPSLLLWLGLPACFGAPAEPGGGDSGLLDSGDSGGGGGDPAVDADGDGYGAGADCDDTSAAIHPGADETCNGIDDDCDQLVDDADPDVTDAPTWSTDGDGDGWGDPATSERACSPPEGGVLESGDCDDADPAVFPGAPETCNDDDDDCDGRVDDEDDDLTDALSFHVDADGDGFGDPEALVFACALPYGATEDATDCDDADSATHPGGQEVCGGGDEDCDGLVDQSDDSVDLSAAPSFHRDADGDGFGDPAVSTAACAAPAGFVGDDRDCDDGAAAVNPDAAEVIGNGVDDDCDGVDAVDHDGDGHASVATGGADCDDADPTVYPGAWDPFGDGLDQGCDGVDGVDADADGWADAATGGEDCDDADPTANPDQVEVWGDGADNDCDGTADTAWAADLAVIGRGSTTSYDLDTTLAPVGDLDGDGVEDLVLGGDYALLLLGPHDRDREVGGDELFGRVTTASRLGDLDGDGQDDLLLGAYDLTVDGTANAGTAWIFYGPLYEAADLDTADATVVGAAASDYVGGTVIGGADLTGDGAPDVAVSAYQDTGEVGVFSGAWTGQRTLDDAVALVTGTGRSWADTPTAIADVDGDGQADLVVGVGLGAGTAGAAYLLLGPLSGTRDVADADWRFEGDAAGTYFGEVVSAGPDVDGDGGADVLVAPQDGYGGVIHFGPWAGRSADLGSVDVVLATEGASDCDGGNCDAQLLDDLDGDGFAEVVVGVGGATGAAGSAAGRGYLFFGPLSGTTDLGGADVLVEGAAAGDDFGYRVGATDADGDGGHDLLFIAKDAGGDGLLYRFDPLE